MHSHHLLPLLGLASVGLSAGAAAQSTLAPIFENSSVNAYDLVIQPGTEEKGFHRHSVPYVYVAMAPGAARIRRPDGSSEVITYQTGQALWGPVEEHAVDNIGSAPLHFVIADVKLHADDIDAEIRAATRAVAAAFMTGDAQGLAAMFTDSGTVWPHGRPSLRGRTAIREEFQRSFAQYSFDFESTIVRIGSSGALAEVRGRNAGKITTRADGSIEEFRESYDLVFRRVGGQWRIVHMMWRPADLD